MGSSARRGKWVAVCTLHLEIKKEDGLTVSEEDWFNLQKGGGSAQEWGKVKGGCLCLNKVWEKRRS